MMQAPTSVSSDRRDRPPLCRSGVCPAAAQVVEEVYEQYLVIDIHPVVDVREQDPHALLAF